MDLALNGDGGQLECMLAFDLKGEWVFLDDDVCSKLEGVLDLALNVDGG